MSQPKPAKKAVENKEPPLTVTLFPLPNPHQSVHEATDVFRFIDPLFYKTSARSHPLQSVILHEYAVRDFGTYPKMFGCLAQNVEDLCVSQAAIVLFVKHHAERLKKSRAVTLFLYKEEKEYCVAIVSVRNDGELSIVSTHFYGGVVWPASFQIHIVVPGA